MFLHSSVVVRVGASNDARLPTSFRFAALINALVLHDFAESSRSRGRFYVLLMLTGAQCLLCCVMQKCLSLYLLKLCVSSTRLISWLQLLFVCLHFVARPRKCWSVLYRLLVIVADTMLIFSVWRAYGFLSF